MSSFQSSPTGQRALARLHKHPALAAFLPTNKSDWPETRLSHAIGRGRSKTNDGVRTVGSDPIYFGITEGHSRPPTLVGDRVRASGS